MEEKQNIDVFDQPCELSKSMSSASEGRGKKKKTVKIIENRTRFRQIFLQKLSKDNGGNQKNEIEKSLERKGLTEFDFLASYQKEDIVADPFKKEKLNFLLEENKKLAKNMSTSQLTKPQYVDQSLQEQVTLRSKKEKTNQAKRKLLRTYSQELQQ